jgi:hypothetical protein
MRELLRARGTVASSDSKSYRLHAFDVPEGVSRLRLSFSYDPGGEELHSLLTLSLFDPKGFRGAGHRFQPRQRVEVAARAATPGFLPGPVPVGRWMAEVDIHSVVAPLGSGSCGYELTVEGLKGDDGDAPGPVHEVAPVAPHGKPRWLRGELHLHSDHSDGRWTAVEMAERARGRGLDFMFLTDHNTVSGTGALRDAVNGAISVLPGCELTTFHGHALALGPRHWVDWRTGLSRRTINDAARDVRAAGGVFVIAHPQAPPDPICTGCCWTHRDFEPALAHAVEVWGGLWDGPEERNPGCLDLWREWLNAGHRLAATGATDAHRPEDWEGPVPLTYLLAEDASLDALLGAIRKGRTYVSSGPLLQLRAVGKAGRTAAIGQTMAGSPPPIFEAWCEAAPAAELRLVGNGRTFGTRAVEGEGRLEASARAGDGWCCAELWSADDKALLAVTSPIYLGA